MSPADRKRVDLLNALQPLVMTATRDDAQAVDTDAIAAAIDLLRRSPEARELYTQIMATSAMLELEHARPLETNRSQAAGDRGQETGSRALQPKHFCWQKYNRHVSPNRHLIVEHKTFPCCLFACSCDE